MRYESREEQLHLIIYSAVAWMSLCILVESLFTFKTLSKKKAHDLKNRIVSIIHGLYSLSLSAYHLYHDQPSYIQKSTELQHFIVLTSIGYFVYDFIACQYYNISDLGLVVHHSLAIGGYVACEYYNNSTISLVGLYLAEISNAPMHIRAILRTIGKRYTKIYELFELVYIVFYIVARGVFATKMVYDTIFESQIPLLNRVACVGIWAQSVFYCKEMVNILRRKNKQENERKKKGISYLWFSEHPDLVKLSYYKRESKDAIF